MKYAGARLLPHVSPSMQSGSVCVQSYMILFQSSPVDMENSRRKLLSKTVKFLYSLIATPFFTPLNINYPSVAKIKKKSIRSMNTLKRAVAENRIVLNSDYRPS